MRPDMQKLHSSWHRLSSRGNFKGVILFWATLSLASCNVSPNLGGGIVPLSQAQATYTQLSSNILQTRCLSCHSDQRPSGQVSFSSYASTMASAGTVVPYQPYQSQLFKMTSTAQMPQGGSSLSNTQLSQIYYWIAYGAPNN